MDTSKLLQFWPSARQTRQERMESSMRFIAYASLITFFMKRDTRIILLGILMILAIYLYMRITPSTARNYNVTDDNPAGNVLLTDDVHRPPTYATSDEISNKLNMPSRWAERQFYTMPNTTVPNDLGAFLEFNGRGAPNCRENQWACTDEGNPRHPEWVQLRGTFGGGR